VTYDLVLSDPGFKGAGIESFTEEKAPMKTVEELKAAYPELVKAIEEAAVAAAKDGLTKELTETLSKQLGEGFDKKIEERVTAEKDAIKQQVIEQLKAEGIEEAKAILVQVAELVRPFLTEAKAEDMADADLEAAKEQVESLKESVSRLEEEVKGHKEQLAEKEQAEAKAEAKRVLQEHIEKVVTGMANPSKVKAILEKCATPAEVDAELPKVKALLEDAVKKDPAKPKGQEDTGEPRPQLTEEQIRQRELAGIKS
jgi:uncharacterized membrane-anchored protein YjiN (DUF445 family)